MSVKTDAYRPPDASERLLPGPPFRGCRISSDFYSTAFATLGESTLAPQGGEMSRSGVKAVLTKGWRAFKRADDPNGWPDQGDVDDYHCAMFPNLPMPRLVVTQDFDDVWDVVGKMVVSLALNLAVLPSDSVLLQFAGKVAHQDCLFDKESGKGGIIDPMGPIGGDGKSRYWAPVGEIRQAAKGFKGGAVVAELYPKGGWTQEALAGREFAAASAADDKTIKRLRRERNEARADLAKCQQGQTPDCAPQVEAARKSARVEALTEAVAAVAALPR